MEFEDLQFPKMSKHRSSYIEMARKCRELGARVPRIPDSELRVTIAYNLAKSAGVDVDAVLEPPRQGGNKTLYPLLSTCVGIARPRVPWGLWIDAELKNPNPKWSSIVSASRGHPNFKK